MDKLKNVPIRMLPRKIREEAILEAKNRKWNKVSDEQILKRDINNALTWAHTDLGQNTWGSYYHNGLHNGILLKINENENIRSREHTC